jgi:hypothetical protein
VPKAYSLLCVTFREPDRVVPRPIGGIFSLLSCSWISGRRKRDFLGAWVSRDDDREGSQDDGMDRDCA